MGNFERIGIQCFSGDLPKLDDEFQGAPRGRAQGHAPPDATNERPAERGSARGSDFDDGSAQSAFENYHDVVDATSSIAREFAADKFRWLETIARDASLPSSATRVAVVVGKHLNRHTRSARPSLERLTRELNLSETTVRSALRKLEAAGHLQISEGGGRGLANVYRMVLRPIHKPSESVKGLEPETPRKDGPYPVKTPSKLAQKGCDFPCPDNDKEQFNKSPLSICPSSRPDDEGQIDKEFDEFWALYPKRDGRAKTAIEYRQARASGVTDDELLNGARHYAHICKDRELRWIATPSNWLRARRWEDARPPKEKLRPTPPLPKNAVTAAVDLACSRDARRTEWTFVHCGSPAWRAWAGAFALAERVLDFGTKWETDGNGIRKQWLGRTFPTEFPPSLVVDEVVDEEYRQ